MEEMVANRRRFLTACSTLGLSATLLPGLLWGRMVERDPNGSAITATPELVGQMASLAGLDINDAERTRMARLLQQQMNSIDQVRKVPLRNPDPPALIFSPWLPGMHFDTERRPTRLAPVAVPRAPRDLEDVAFY
ncbi:MAG: hypothetical protein ACRD1Y_11120, partial [Terriglobales bacterium]